MARACRGCCHRIGRDSRRLHRRHRAHASPLARLPFAVMAQRRSAHHNATAGCSAQLAAQPAAAGCTNLVRQMSSKALVVPSPCSSYKLAIRSQRLAPSRPLGTCRTRSTRRSFLRACKATEARSTSSTCRRTSRTSVTWGPSLFTPTNENAVHVYSLSDHIVKLV